MASVICKWGKKKWKITPKQIKSLDDFSYDQSYNTDKKKKDKRKANLSYTIYLETGNDVRKEITSWYKLLGKKNGLYIGKKRFGPAKMRLDSANSSSIHVTDNGRVHYATIALEFTEP